MPLAIHAHGRAFFAQGPSAPMLTSAFDDRRAAS